MCNRTPWTAMGIICGYTLLKSEGFKAQRIVRVTNCVGEMEKRFDQGKITVEEVSKRLMDKADWTVEYVEYTEADIRAKKGSYQYWLDQKQLAPQNAINKQSTRYMLFMFAALMDEFGYGKDRLTRVQEFMNNLLLDYQQDKVTVMEWHKALLEETGVVFEPPIDPLTQTAGSMMTGM
ncbi:MAG: hypothetical protein K6G30_12095 [Acetatifactor sp.]|nr:hypothetical protein [Acetatifactor sp.]